uniref:Uncharacterized protein n=1 Tax=Anguilla anguilla TaxID=7936 RepID=A0A0E9PTB8_ANGAN
MNFKKNYPEGYISGTFC